MVATESGMVKLVNELHSEKARCPMAVTESGMVTVLTACLSTFHSFNQAAVMAMNQMPSSSSSSSTPMASAPTPAATPAKAPAPSAPQAREEEDQEINLYIAKSLLDWHMEHGDDNGYMEAYDTCTPESRKVLEQMYHLKYEELLTERGTQQRNI